ncbi:Long chain base biosynthesis protein 2a (AtLCB2a) (Long chain base biosynthesis protein 2) (AtLCB2) [Durusdinium trenchii]
MTFLQEAHAYWGYVRLFCLGLIREYIVRACAVVLQDDISVRYVKREKWSVGWTDFYLQHMYKLYVDCFARPISSAPDAKVEVVIRERAGGDLFGPLNDLKLTEKRKMCVNLSSYNYLGFGGVDEYCTPVARKAARELGWSTSGTRTEGGTKAIHQDLEREVAKYLSKEDALVLGMGRDHSAGKWVSEILPGPVVGEGLTGRCQSDQKQAMSEAAGVVRNQLGYIVNGGKKDYGPLDSQAATLLCK